MADAETKRQIKIKTGVIKRCVCLPASRWRLAVVAGRCWPQSPAAAHTAAGACCLPLHGFLNGDNSTLQEIKMYETEQGQQEAKIAKMKEDGVDEYDVRKQEEVLAETVMMIPERRTALEAAAQDLTDLLVSSAQAALRGACRPEHHLTLF